MNKTVFRVEIEMGNDGLRTVAALRKVLADLLPRLNAIADGGEERLVRDVNGNTAGKAGFYLKRERRTK